MKKTLALILAVIMILTMSACAGTNDTPQNPTPPPQQNPGEETTQQETESAPTDPASDGIPLSEYLKNESDTPLVFFDASGDTKETVPYTVYAFQNGKVKVIPNFNNYSFGDFAKMTDAEVLQSVEQAFETFMRSYVEEWQAAMDLMQEGNPTGKYPDNKYHVTNWYLDRKYDKEENINCFKYSKGESLYEGAIAQVQNLVGRYAQAHIYFHPTKYYLPDYVDYAFNIISDDSGNNVEKVYLAYNIEKYFDGDFYGKFHGWGEPPYGETFYKFIPDVNAGLYSTDTRDITGPFDSFDRSNMETCTSLVIDGNFHFKDTYTDDSGKTYTFSEPFNRLTLFTGQPEYHGITFSVYDSTFYSISSSSSAKFGVLCTRDENVQNVIFEHIKGEPIDDSKVGGNVLVDALPSEIWKVFQDNG